MNKGEYFGKYKGFVRDNADPQNRGRVRCYCPQVMGPKDAPELWLGWAETNHPWLGGLTIVNGGAPLTKTQNGGKEVGVWLEFEGGNLDFPVWTGTFTIAEKPADGPIDLTQTEGSIGGSIITTPPTGSDVEAINPPKPLPAAREIRLMAPEGLDIVIMTKNGGSVIIGPAGVHVQGTFCRVNGREVSADLSTVVG